MMTNHGRTATSPRRTPGLAAAAAVLLISMSGAASASVVDQVSPATDSAFSPPPDFIFSLYRGVGWHDSGAEFSSFVTPVAGTMMPLDVSALDLMLCE